MLQRCIDKKNTMFPVCCCVEMHYLLSAVAGRRQDERPSIRPQNKVKRVRFIPDLIPGCVKNPPSPVNKYSAGRRRERNPLRPIQKPINLQPANLLAVSRLNGASSYDIQASRVAAFTSPNGSPTVVQKKYIYMKNHQYIPQVGKQTFTLNVLF